MTAQQKQTHLHFLWAWLLASSVLLLRSWQEIANPAMLFEDRHFLLPLYFNQHQISSIFSEHLGYASVGPQLLAFLIGYLPLTWAPYAYAASSLMLCALAFSVFALPQFHALCTNPRHRVLICLLMAILPLGRTPLVSNITYSEFNVLFILVMLVSTSTFRRANILLDGIIIPLCIASHPASITLMPLYLLNIYFGDQKQKLQQLCWIGITVLYIQFLVDHSSTETMDFDYILLRLLLAATAFAGKVMVEPWIGGYASSDMFRNGNFFDVGHAYMANGILVGLLFIIYATFFLGWHTAKKQRRESMVYMIVLTGFGVLYLSMLTRLNGWGWAAHVQEPFLQRYVYVARLCSLVFFCCIISAWLEQHIQWRKIIGFVVLMVFVFAMRSGINNRWLYGPDIAASTALLHFLDQVGNEIDDGNHACREKKDCIRTLEPDSRWPVVLDLSEH